MAIQPEDRRPPDFRQVMFGPTNRRTRTVMSRSAFSLSRMFRSALPLAGVALLLLADSALAQLPAAKLQSIFPSGGKAGSTLEVTINGTDLDDGSALHFSHP